MTVTMMDDLLSPPSTCRVDDGQSLPSSKPIQEKSSRQKQLVRRITVHPRRRRRHRRRHETSYCIQQQPVMMRMRMIILTIVLTVICTILTAFSNNDQHQQSYVAVVDAFASNLVVTTIGCMTDLSTDEIIMNNEVKLPEESDYPKMHLVVLDDDDNHVESPYKYHSSSLSDSSSSPTELKLAFVNPYKDTDEGRDLGDIQFVMEIGVVGGSNEGGGEEEESPSSPASFIDGGAIGCDGNKRVSASLRDYDGHVKLRINDPTSNIRVWAGWATGQESVRLVPDLILEPAFSDGGGATQKEGEINEAGRESEKEDININGDNEEGGESRGRRDDSKKADAKRTKPKKNPLATNDVHPELKKAATDVRRKIGDVENANGHDRGSRARGGGMKQQLPGQDQNLDLAASTTSDRRPHHHHDGDGNGNEEKPKIPRKDLKTLQEEERQRRRDLEAQMRKNFLRADNASDLDLLSYGIGCGFFIVSMGIIVIVFGKKPDNKGRRDL